MKQNAQHNLFNTGLYLSNGKNYTDPDCDYLPTIRLKCNYLILLKLGSKKDLSLILGDYGLGVDKTELMAIYKDAIQIPFNFLKISTDEREDSKRFSKNWNDFYAIGSDSESDEV